MGYKLSNQLRLFTFLLILLLLFPFIVNSSEYRIEPGDVLVITVYEQPDLTTKVRVTTKGEISFPLLGTIQVSGLTVNELQKRLTELLEKDYLVNPQVNVFIEEYHPRKVFVIGAVNKPGEYELFKDRPTTVLEAITMAGGFKEVAAQNNTRIIRVGGSQEQTIPIKITDIIQKGDKSKDIPVEPGDIVVVPESFF